MSCCTKFSSKADVPVLYPCMKPCRSTCNVMAERRRLFIIEVHTIQITFTNPIPLNSSSPFGIITIVVRIIYAGMKPSWNDPCVILTRFSHLFLMGSLSCVASMIHDFRSSACIPESTTALTMWIPLTDTAIYSHRGGTSDIYYGHNKIRIGSTSGVFCMKRSDLFEEIFSSPSLVRGGECPLELK